MLQGVSGHTYHKRIGGPDNAFRYGVDYVLTEPERPGRMPTLFSHGARNVMSLRDRDNGGAPGKGRGAAWVRDILRERGLTELAEARVLLLTQPRVFGYLFNPVSFWLIMDADETLRAVIAEVSNTFGDRHSYLCHHDDLRPITRDDVLEAEKIFHVSPFQPVGGTYRFRFAVAGDHIGIRIDFLHGNGGLVATLSGTRRTLTTRGILRVLLRRPLGSLRVMALIHWQALKLKLKGAPYRRRPTPPEAELS